MAGSSSIHPDEQWLLSIAEHHGGGRPNEPSADILREALTQSEVQRLTEAMSNTDFCELLQEYTKQVDIRLLISPVLRVCLRCCYGDRCYGDRGYGDRPPHHPLVALRSPSRVYSV